MEDKIIILKDLKEYIKANYKHSIKHLILFGSRARNENNEDSDYDILIVLKDNYNWKDEDRIIDLCCDINLKYNILIDPHLLSEKEINTLKGKQPVFSNALKSGLYV